MRMRTLSREAVLVTAGVAILGGALLIVPPFAVPVASWATAPSSASVSPSWPLAALAVVVVGATLVLPPAVLLGGAIVTGHGLGLAALQEPLVGPLLISDVLLLVHLVRSLVQRHTERETGHGWVSLWLALFLTWSFLATIYAGAEVTPLLRITLYGGVFCLLAHRGTDRTLAYGIVLCYALVNLAGGVFQGQPRLVGLDIGDPAQMGALLLAALCPLLACELRFLGRWVVGAVLLYGIFLTQTRSVWFATVVVLVVWAQKKVSLVRLALIFLVLALLGLKIVEAVTQWFDLNPFSADLRSRSVINGIRSGLENPFFGSGWGQVSSMDYFGSPLPDSVDHVMPYNLFVSVFASVGLPAILMLVLFFGALLRRLAHRRGAAVLFTVGVLAMSLTEMTLYAGSLLTLLLFTYAGMGLGPSQPSGGGIGWTSTRSTMNQHTVLASSRPGTTHASTPSLEYR